MFNFLKKKKPTEIKPYCEVYGHKFKDFPLFFTALCEKAALLTCFKEVTEKRGYYVQDKQKIEKRN